MPSPRSTAKRPAAKSAAARNLAARDKSPPAAPKKAKTRSEPLPQWELSSLYPGINSPEVKRDLARSDEMCLAFEERYKGKLDALAGIPKGGAALAAAIGELEAIEDLLGRIASFGQLVYYDNTTDPIRAKFFGDMQERITTSSSHLLFFTLELNHIADEVLAGAMADPALAHYRPWIDDLRKEKPYQLEDRVEQLFHEKSVTGQGAWNRLFDDTIASLRFKIGARSLAIEPTLNLLQDRDEKTRKAAAVALGKTFRNNLRTFTLITNTLAKDKEISDRWRGFTDIADARHLANRVEREVVEALVAAVREAYPAIPPLLRTQSAVVWQEAAGLLGPQRAIARGPDASDFMVGGKRYRSLRLSGVFARDGAHRGAIFFRSLD